jgi:hypothetical protein
MTMTLARDRKLRRAAFVAGVAVVAATVAQMGRASPALGKSGPERGS